MINISDYVVFYIKNTKNSGAYKAFEYANRKIKKFKNINEFLSYYH